MWQKLLGWEQDSAVLKQEDNMQEGLRTFRSLSVEEGGAQNLLLRQRDDSIDLPCMGFPDYPEDLHLQQIILSGWLDKTPPKGGRRFQRRWVQLDWDYLRYFQNHKEVYSKRMVSLACVSGVVQVGEQRFEIVTQGRTFLFRAPTNKQRDEWLSCLWKVLGSRRENRCGHGFFKTAVSTEGYLEMTSPRTKVYTVVKDHRVYLFKNHEEYLQGIGITEIDMSRASVKQTSKFFSISTPYRTFSFMVDSEVERQQWVACLMVCVSQSSANRVCDKVWSLESNRVCADCGTAMPDWASVHLCVLLCEQCAGVHQCLGQSVSKVFSLKSDECIWTDDLIKVFLLTGNSKANQFWAPDVPVADRLNPNASSSDRIKHITAKYLEGTYCKRHALSGQQEALNNALCTAVQTDNLVESLSLLFSGAEISCNTGIPEFPSPLALAKHTGQTAQVELLQHHLPAGPVSSDVSHTPVHSHNGHLFKVASSARPIIDHKPRTDFSQRWCCLGDGVFSYYKTEQSTSRCGYVKTSDIICLSINSPGSHGYEHTFELYTDSGRVYLFGADDAVTIKEWIRAIATAMLPAVLSDVCGLCDLLGRLRCAEGSSGIGWFCLSGSTLQMLLQDSVQNIDLRKLLTLTLCDSVGDMVLGWRGGSLHVVADRRPHFPGWVRSIELCAGSGDQPLPLQQLTESGIPIPVDRCLDHITRHGLMSVGIYRKNGVNSHVLALLEALLRDARSVCLDEHCAVDNVASTLKRFLREVREGVFSGEQNSQNWLSTAELTDHWDKTSTYQTLLSGLPEVNRETLKALFNHLYCVQNFSNINQMTARNLGIVFGPTLFQTDRADPRTSKVVEDLIQNYCAIFNTLETELQKQMDATLLILNKVKDQASLTHVPSHTVCAVYLEKREEDAELLVQVGVSTTVEELVLEVLEKRGIRKVIGEFWRCYEIKEEIERELHYKEEVLPVCYSLSLQSHLLVKRSHYTSDITTFLYGKEEVCKRGTLQVCEVKGGKAKGFCSRCCELKGSSFRLYREQQGSQCDREWPVKEIKVFQGYRSKLQPPTPYLCCRTEDEFIEWLATVMSLQHDGDLG